MLLHPRWLTLTKSTELNIFHRIIYYQQLVTICRIDQFKKQSRNYLQSSYNVVDPVAFWMAIFNLDLWLTNKQYSFYAGPNNAYIVTRPLIDKYVQV